ncbi:hypothetical protein ACF8R6_10320 [Pseudomonas sp. CJQ_7]|uniref:hypothetical protein n=1 Tax=Pseudomonas sp. CJQ_7 TaxID=3367166 RepID=UPI00370AE54C
MDYPKSVPNAGLVGGKFVDEDTGSGTPGSLIPSDWGNAITDEVLAVIAAAGLEPDENDNTQMAAALRLMLQQAAGNYALDTGTANTYLAAYTPAVADPVDGMVLKFKAKTANTGASTFSPNGLLAKPIVGLTHAALRGGEIVANGDVWLQYNSSIGGGSWVLINSTGGATGRLLNVQVFSASGTYTPTPGMKSAIIEARAGGGGSGGIAATSSSQYGVAGGAGGGARAVGKYSAAEIGAGQVVTIGQGGAGGASGSVGSNGGTTSVGSLISAAGGTGGNPGSITTLTSNINAGALGGQTIVGGNLIAEPGQPGGMGIYVNNSFRGGNGGGPAGGVGGVISDVTPPSGGLGSGAGGHVAGASASARSGSSGGNGYVVIWEYA